MKSSPIAASPDQIIADCATAFGVTLPDIHSPACVLHNVSLARQTAMVVICRRCQLHPVATAAFFNRHRTTVLYAQAKIAAFCETDPPFKKTFEALLAGNVLPYAFPLSTKYVQKTDALPLTTRTYLRPEIEIGLAVLAVCLVREGQQKLPPLSHSDIAEICGVSHNAIFNLEKLALKKLREKLRRLLGLSYGQFAVTRDI